MTIHEAVVSLLKQDYPELATKSYRRSVSALELVDLRRDSDSYSDLTTYEADLDWEKIGPIDWAWYWEFGERVRFSRIPDCYFLDFHTQMLVTFEVEDSHKIDLNKLRDYYDLYFLHLDPFGWGISLISVDRWGKRSPIRLFDYVFAEMLGNIPEGTLLNVIQDTMQIEHAYSISACNSTSEWNASEMFDLISDARQDTNHLFWQSADARNAFEKIFKSR